MREYGITTSEAFWWVHVCPLDATFYTYRRETMQRRIGRYREARIESAIGRLAPIRVNLRANGGFIFETHVGYDFIDQWDWARAASDKALGETAEKCFFAACNRGLFWLPVRADRYNRREDQYKGMDFRCALWPGGDEVVNVEVKGDYQGGVWGTGNLFVQTHEGTKVDGDAHAYEQRLAHRSTSTPARAVK